MRQEKFIRKCYKCNIDVKKKYVVKDGIKLYCLKCPRCGEEYFTSSELMKYDILTGKRKMARKFGTLGESSIVRIPEKVIKAYNIKPGDFAYFEELPQGILIKPVQAKALKKLISRH